MRASPSRLFPVLLVFLAACMSEQPHCVFDTGDLSEKERARIRRECDYETGKVTASAPINVASLRWERLHIGRAEPRGVRFRRMSDQLSRKP